MANQMIALGVRGPQLPNIGGIAQQYANVMANMAAAREKQGAAQRANQFRQLVQGGLDVTTPEGYAQIAGLDPEGAAALRKSALDTQAAQAKLALDFLGASQEELSRANTPEDAMAVGRMLKQAYPMFAQNIDETLKTLPADPAQFSAWRQNTNMSALKSADRMKYFLDEVTTESIIGEKGKVGVLTRGGLTAPTLVTPETYEPGPETSGQVELGEQTTVEPGVGGPVNADEVERFIQSFPREAQAAIRQRVSEGALGNVPMGSPVPVGLVAGERGGVGGPYEGYVKSAEPFRAKNPALAPYPGSAQVPITRVRQEAMAQRETPEEVYQKELARERARVEVAANAPPKKLTAPQEQKLRANIAKDYKSARSTIEMMDGVTRAVNDVRNLSRDQKEAITGWSGYAPSLLPSSRSADVKLKNLQGKVTEMGKAAASLTGAIGQMAVQEWRIVSDMIANLDVTGMEPADLDNQLDIIEGQARRAADVTRDAYENQYMEEFARYPGRFQLSSAGTRAPAQRSAAPKIPTLTPEQARRAPKGTRYRTTDGRILER